MVGENYCPNDSGEVAMSKYDVQTMLKVVVDDLVVVAQKLQQKRL